jgi:hypothetical protein
MYPESGQSTETLAARIRVETTGEALRELEERLAEAIQSTRSASAGDPSESVNEALGKAFEAAKRILEKARTLQP